MEWKSLVDSDRSTFYRFHHLGEVATHPIARLASRLAVLLLLVGGGPTVSSRLAIQPASRTLGRVQLAFLGSSFAHD
jgi:hypothetical protein